MMQRNEIPGFRRFQYPVGSELAAQLLEIEELLEFSIWPVIPNVRKGYGALST
jgi:hypothetical protein